MQVFSCRNINLIETIEWVLYYPFKKFDLNSNGINKLQFNKNWMTIQICK